MTPFLPAGVWDQKGRCVCVWGSRPHLPTPGASSTLGGERSEWANTMPQVVLGPPPRMWGPVVALCSRPPQGGATTQLPRLCPGLAPPLGASILASAEEGGPSSPVPAVHSATAQKHNGLPAAGTAAQCARGKHERRCPLPWTRATGSHCARPLVSDCTHVYSTH
ncbi:hypothetical protein mRhiFer1_009281 [Rhinolophus ferrumequinum]|uniref:Uncharacterized protein n=1 Tax=Rhinolophus ferrumequinum TaxID=59479 RepID=A0A7J7RXN8_RHIFE|nr:hypothetical protein mRhiFer1_009281 [Rhinolophus ferrumequinum]